MYDITLKDEPHDFIIKGGYISKNSHATSYAGIALIGAYIKAHYPAEYLAGFLTVNSENLTDKTNKKQHLEAIQDIKNYGFKLSMPDVNTSPLKFEPRYKKILYGLCAVPTLNTAAATELISKRPYGVGNISCAKLCSWVTLFMLSTLTVTPLGHISTPISIDAHTSSKKPFCVEYIFPFNVPQSSVYNLLKASYNKWYRMHRKKRKTKKKVKEKRVTVIPSVKLFDTYNVIMDFRRRISTILNKTSLNTLIELGAFDSIIHDRNVALRYAAVASAVAKKSIIASKTEYASYLNINIEPRTPEQFMEKEITTLGLPREIPGIPDTYDSFTEAEPGDDITIGGIVIKAELDRESKSGFKYSRFVLRTPDGDIWCYSNIKDYAKDVKVGMLAEVRGRKRRGFSASSSNILVKGDVKKI